MRRRDEGIALVVTLVLALVLFLAVVAITTTMSIGNRETASNQGVAVRAQFSAESGLNQADQKLVAVAKLLDRFTVDLGTGGNYVAAQDALFRDMYRFCYGDPGSVVAGAPSYASFALLMGNTMGAKNQTVCAAALPINAADSDAAIATNRMQIFLDSTNGGYIPFTDSEVAKQLQKIDNRAISGTSPNLAAEQAMWATLARGRPFAQNLNSSGGYKDSFSTAITLAPISLTTDGDGRFVFTMGKPDDTSAGVQATGLVQSTSGTSVANRVLTRSSLMSLALKPPSFARFAFFYNSHFLNGTKADTTSVVKIRSGFKVTGPMYTNGNYIFESNAADTITLAGEVGSAGCDDGAASFYTNGTAVTGTPTPGASTQPGCVQRSTAKKWAGTPKQGYYLDGMGNYVPVSDPKKATGFGSALKLDTVYQDEDGNQLCGTVTDEYEGLRKCSDIYPFPLPTPDSAKARKVEWDRSVIPLPTDGTTKFDTDSAAGGFRFDTADYGAPGSYTAVSLLTDATVFSTPFPALDTSHTNAINRFTGTPVVYLSIDKVSSKQRIKITGTQITGFVAAVTKSCYTPPNPNPGPSPSPNPPPPPGDPGAAIPHAPSVAHGFDFARVKAAFVQFLTAGSSASALTVPTTPKCSQEAYNRYAFNWNATTASVSVEYQVDTDKSISLVSSSYLNASYPPVDVNTSLPFNGTIYSTGALYMDSGSDQSDVTNPNGPQRATRDLPEIAKYSQISVAAKDTVYIRHDITYEENPIGWPENKPKPTNLLGVYAGNNVWFNSGNKTDIKRYQNFNVNGVIMAQNGSVGNYDACNTSTSNVDKGDLNIVGSVIQNRLGSINCKFAGPPERRTGYTGNYQYDQRMAGGMAPPSFPQFTAGNFKASNSFKSNRSFIRVVPGN